MLSQKDLGCQEIQWKLLVIVYCTEIVENIKMKFVFVSSRRVSFVW